MFGGSVDEGPRNPPGNREFSASELANYNGSDPEQPVYLAIKGTVFDVSKARAMYTPPAGYSVFAGKDASRGLAKSSLKPEDCVANIDGLSEEETATLEKWDAFYRKKYDIVGKTID
ncbi:hypothetical protein HK097_001302 [Rhizophlyctis rosea]|uniref:Cytochrome b5 heme-binding domain-containing protein n=1 Tax=Rhizophlyctis rosea TaxID=64517 RepID=A0AAD5SCJ2_9FUNG|nr:hypothetical protein HK097_001302 [Rhizophlyctis rosea]